MQTIPTVVCAVLGMNLAENRISKLFGLEHDSFASAALNGGAGAGLGALVGFLIGLVLIRMFSKNDKTETTE